MAEKDDSLAGRKIIKCYDCDKLPSTIYQWEVESKIEERAFIILCKECFDKRIGKAEGNEWEGDPDY